MLFVTGFFLTTVNFDLGNMTYPFAVPEIRFPRYRSANFDRGTRFMPASSTTGGARKRAPRHAARLSPRVL